MHFHNKNVRHAFLKALDMIYTGVAGLGVFSSGVGGWNKWMGPGYTLLNLIYATYSIQISIARFPFFFF